MEFEKKIDMAYGSSDAIDYPEDRLRDLLQAVKQRIEQVDLQIDDVEEENELIQQ